MSARSPPPQQSESLFSGMFFTTKEDENGRRHSDANNSGRPPAPVYMEPTQATSIQSQSPIHMTCPHCREKMETEVVYERGMGAWLIAALICISGCCCFAWIPLVTNMMLDAVHMCPLCRREVGRYIRLQPSGSRRVRRRPKRQAAREASNEKSTGSDWRSGSRKSAGTESQSSWRFGSKKSDNKSPSSDSTAPWPWNKSRSASARLPNDGKRDITERERRAIKEERKRKGSLTFW